MESDENGKAPAHVTARAPHHPVCSAGGAAEECFCRNWVRYTDVRPRVAEACRSFRPIFSVRYGHRVPSLGDVCLACDHPRAGHAADVMPPGWEVP